MTTRPPLPRSVVLLGWVSFFADVSSEMAYPLLPLFIVGVLGAPATALGGIEGVALAAVAILTAVSGWHSDRTRRRVGLIRWGYGLPVIGKSMVAAATVWPVVLCGRAIDRIGKGLRASPRDALIADAAGPSQRGRAFGFHRAMDTAGATVGVVLSPLILFWLGAWSSPDDAAASGTAFRIVFVTAAALGLASLGLTFILKDERAADDQPTSTVPRPDPAQQATSSSFGARFWLVLGMLLLFALANSSDAFLLLRAGDVGLSPLQVVLAYALFNLTYTLASYPAGALSDRFGRWRMIAAGWLIYAVVYTGFAITGAAGVWPLMALYGCYMAMTDGVGKALIADLAPRDRRGTAMGIMYLTLGFGALASSLIAGWLWDHIGSTAPFWFGAGAALAAVVTLVGLRSVIILKPAPQIGA